MPKDERIISQNEFMSQAANNAPEEEYNPDDHLDESSFKRMGFALWLAENRRKITKIFIGFLIAVSTFFFSFTIYNLVIYFKFGSPAQQIVEGNVNTAARKQTEDLVFSSVSTFKTSDSTDFVVQIKNPNSNFSAGFDYCFMSGEEEIYCGSDFIMPAEEKYVLSLGVNRKFSETSFLLKKITWKRLDTKNIPDFSSFKSSRLNFQITDLSFSPAASGISGNIDLNWLEFSVLNNTAYSYYEAPLDILIFRSGILAGVNRYVLNNFRSGESRPVRMTWSGDLRGAKDVQIVPAIDIFDDSVYLKYQGNN